ncbi:hypothetical protein [Tahibacter amnicola]|uniref:Plasmid stabilization protein n=1 Tax=Tahibacter amnicola TaxID=2976241 RepID=A0ABY6BDG6_9GAMM|nr:hypothetical protein [Tahibacter amnicola]UXI68078.1 hypothetical protein N4264_00035 [Tahibacter amnicola]
MPRGDKSAYSGKQKRKAEHIEDGYEEQGVSRKEAERRAWATVNKQDGGAKPGPKAKHPTRKSTRAGTAKKAAGRKSVAKKTTRPAAKSSARKTTPKKGVTGTTRKSTTKRATTTPRAAAKKRAARKTANR